MSLLDKASLIITPNAYKASKLYSVVPSSGAGDMTVVRATTATRVNSLGLIESVSVNIPRIDYTNGSCPSLLVEPQRTNIFTYSEQFDNSFWIKGAVGGVANPIVTPNVSISPDGTTNADRVDFPSISAGQTSIIFVPFSSATTENYTQSYYIKGLLGTEVIWITYTSDGITFVTKVCNLTTGWQRFDLSALIPAGGSNVSIGVDTRDPLQTVRPAQTVFFWGGQLETAAYATSYIPTVASSVTRNSDVISKTGISSLIGQTEGTVFVDVTLPNDASTDIFNFEYEGVNDVFLASNSGNLLGRIYYNGSPLFFAQYAITLNGGRFKMLMSYKSGNSSFYINGTLLSNNSSTFAFTNTLSKVNLTNVNYAGYNKKQYNSVQIYKTALTDAECIVLTTI